MRPRVKCGNVDRPQGIKVFNPQTVYDNLSDRGCVIAEFTPTKAVIHWIYVDTIDSDQYEIAGACCKTLEFPAT